MTRSDNKKELYNYKKFVGDKEEFDVFMIRFENWETSKSVEYASAIDHGDALVMKEVFTRSRQMVVDTANPANMVEWDLTDEEKELYKANALAVHKMTKQLDDTLVPQMKKHAGPNNLMFEI